MATSNVRVNLTADPSNLERGFKSAERSASVFARELAKVEAVQQRQGVMMAQATREMESEFARRRQVVRGFTTDAGQLMLGFGAALTVGLGFAAKAAMEWESAFAGVRKVVDGSDQEIAALEQQLRNLATTLPASATEIAGVAEAAGQLGVAQKDIVSFTQTMIALGVSTNLSADEAATGLARLGNIMGVLPDQAGRAGAALVALGNDGASTESEILSMGLRIAGAGRQIGLSEAQVLGFANTLSSLGIEAEAGGTAISRVMLDIQQAVTNGGDKLGEFAKIAGTSAGEFAESFRTDAAGAIQAFIGGLGRMSENGENTVAALDRLDLSEIRVRDTLLRTSGAVDLLSASLATGSEAWSEQSALLEEASKRYQTAESRLQVARNQINDAAIDIGASVLPAFAAAAGAAGDMASAFTTLPGPVKDSAVALGVAAAAVGLLGGAALIAIPKVAALLDTLDSFGGRGAKAAGKLRGSIGAVTGALAGPWGLALAGATVGLGIWAAKQAEAKARVDELKNALDQQTGAVTDQARAMVAAKLGQDGVLESAKNLGLSLALVTDAALGNVDAQSEVNATLAYQSELARQAGRAGQEQRSAVTDVSVAINGQNEELTAAQEKIRLHNEAMGETATATEGYAEAQAKAGDSTRLTADAVDDLSKEMQGLNDDTLNARSAARDFEAAIDAAGEAAKENGRTLDINTAKGRANQDALDGIASAALRTAEAILHETGSEQKMHGSLDKSRAKLAAAAQAMGLSKKAANELANSLIKIPDRKTVQVTVTGLQKGIDDAGRLNEAVARIDGRVITLRVALQNPGLEAGIARGTTPGRATGGEVSGVGTGTSDSNLYALSKGEHVLTASEVTMAGGQASVYRMRAAIRAGSLQGFASGGAVGDSKESRIRELLRELNIDVRRGDVLGSVRGGLDGGYSVVDRLMDLSRNADVSKRQRSRLADLAREAEPALRRLWAHAEKIDRAMERANGRLEAMTQVRDQISGDLSGRFSIGDAVKSATTQYDRADGTIGTRVDVVRVRKSARAYAVQLKTLADRLTKLRKLGMPTGLLQELAGLPPDDAIAAADAWIALGAGEVKSVAAAFAGIGRYADSAGTAVADSMFKGGIAGAKAIVDGLESRSGEIEEAVTKLGKRMQAALLKSLGAGKSKSTSSASVEGSSVTLSVPVGASASGMSVSGGTTNNFILDSAAAASTAKGYASEVVQKQNRQVAVMSRRSS